MVDTQGYTTHVVRAGDSLQKIAIVYGIDNWQEIAYFNKLDYPYIVDEVTFISDKNVARVGSILYIPNYDYSTSPRIDEITDEKMEEQAYGCDLDIYSAVDDNGKAQNLETKGELASTNNDLRVVKGISNLKQQLQIRLSTPKGSLMLHPEYGCDITNMVGLKGTTENLMKMMLTVQECLLQDFRVTGIENLSITNDEDMILIECDIHPIAPYPQFSFSSTITE